jgi:hypothetical protein
MAGRPRHQPTARERQTVEILAGFGIPNDKIKQVIGISKPTLERHYRNELDQGAAKVEAQLAGSLLRIARGSDGAALKAITFALQCRFGWHFTVDPGFDPAPQGKKEAAQEAARTAGEQTEWGEDLRTPGSMRPN